MEQVLARLEKVTDRLERLEASRGSAPAGALPSQPQYAVKAAPAAAPATTAAAATPSSAAASTWTQLLRSYLDPLVQASGSLTDPEVHAAFKPFQLAFEAVGPVLQAAGTTKRPDGAGLQSLLAPVAQQMMDLGKKTEGRRTDAYNHVKALSESINALSWLAYDGPSSGISPPQQHVAESWQSAEFFTTRILKEFKDKGEAHVTWVKALRELMQQLEAFVQAHYPQGPTWGVPNAAARAPGAGPAAAPAPRAGGPPPPPPPPGAPPPPLSVAKIQQASSGAGAAAGADGGGAGGSMSALFQELSTQNLTAGLKKVTDDMKTKNRADRTAVVTMPDKPETSAAGGGGRTAGAAGGRVAGGAAGIPTGTPALELRDRKWYAEFQVGAKQLVIEATDPRQSVYVYACKDSMVMIKGKVNNISIDSCVKTGVMFGDVIASCEVVNCKNIKMQADGMVPTISVEKTDGCQLYVNKRLSSQPDFQIVTAKCSAMNIVVMGTAEEDPVDLPIPEQFISSFQNGQLVTVAASHSGA